jgi:hypothetical protein
MQGLATQLFTEVGNYHISFVESSQSVQKRMVAVTCAISIDYDYFSRRVRGNGFLFLPFIWTDSDS